MRILVYVHCGHRNCHRKIGRVERRRDGSLWAIHVPGGRRFKEDGTGLAGDDVPFGEWRHVDADPYELDSETLLDPDGMAPGFWCRKHEGRVCDPTDLKASVERAFDQWIAQDVNCPDPARS